MPPFVIDVTTSPDFHTKRNCCPAFSIDCYRQWVVFAVFPHVPYRHVLFPRGCEFNPYYFFSLFDHMTPSGRYFEAAMCGGKGLFFVWPSAATQTSNCSSQSSLDSKSGFDASLSCVLNLDPSAALSCPFTDADTNFDCLFGAVLPDKNRAFPRLRISRIVW